MYTFDLTGKTVLITGGYGYLGKAIVESLLYHNANVYVLARSKVEFERAFGDNYKQLHFTFCDITSTESINDAFFKIFNETKSIDALINNAFYSKGQNPFAMEDSDWQWGIDGVLNSVYRCIRAVLPYFQKCEKGKIINVSSMYGMVAPQFDVYESNPEFLNPPHYGAAKAGVIQLTKYYASLLGPMNITVNAVTPGPFPSVQVQKNEGFVMELSKKTCLGRIGKPEDLAGAFVYLVSDAANFMTGHNLVIDGGWTIK